MVTNRKIKVSVKIASLDAIIREVIEEFVLQEYEKQFELMSRRVTFLDEKMNKILDKLKELKVIKYDDC